MKIKNLKLKIIFTGTPRFASIILEKLANTEYRPVLVITGQDKPIGRKKILFPPPAKIIAQKYGLKVLQPRKIKELKSKIKDLKPDLIITAAYGHLIPKSILDIPYYGSINIHPSLLPKYRGPSPIQSVILNGDKKTGVTIILMDEKIDHGPILAKQELKIPISNIQFSKLYDELARLGIKLLTKTIPKIIKGEIKPIPQNHSKATFTKIIKKEDGHIDWKKSAEEIERQIRAFQEWPKSYSFWNNKILKILEAEVSKEKIDKKIGQIFLIGHKKLAVQCGQNCLILLKLQLEGKKPMTVKEFLNGNPKIINSILK